MLKGRKIVAFVATTNPAAARKFYGKTLGLKLLGQHQFALVFDAGGTTLRVALVPELRPAGYTVLGWIVPDIKRAATDLAKKGVRFQRYEWMEQDAQGIWTAPSRAKIAWFPDADGNILSLTEYEEPGRRRAPARRARGGKRRPRR